MTGTAQTGRGPRRRRAVGRRGSATMEFVLAIPLLALVLGLTMFFGWALMHKHQVIVADRYSSWQRVTTGQWPSEEKINELCFNDRASDVDLDGTGPVRQTVYEWVQAAGGKSGQAEALADELYVNRFPTGKRARVSATFQSNQALWERFSGAISHRHGREGVTWRRDEVRCWTTLRDQYYGDVDNLLQRVPAPADGMANMIRGLYLARW